MALIDLFAHMGLARAFTLDEAALRRTYLQMSRQAHPDFHTQALPAARQEAEEWAALTNKAYATLRDPHRRMAHLLELEGVLPEEGQARLPQSFLMDMMDLNEAIMELDPLEGPMAADALRQQLRATEQELLGEAGPEMEAYDHGEQAALEKVSTFYLQRRYLQRLWNRLDSSAPANAENPEAGLPPN